MPPDDAFVDPVDAILALHGFAGPWTSLPATGVANRIYATDKIVLRVATEHPEAIADARTESVAAPIARAAGIKTPRLLAFDDSRTLVGGPYSLWERVHGETVGLLPSRRRLLRSTWTEVGHELAQLHGRVETCPDPNGWLDVQVAEDALAYFARWNLQKPTRGLSVRIERCLGLLSEQPSAAVKPRFLHGDLYDMNLMCDPSGRLLALIDWGDAGWGDPALDFVDVPLSVLGLVIGIYQRESGNMLGSQPLPRILRYRFGRVLRRASLGRDGALDALGELVQFTEAACAGVGR